MTVKWQAPVMVTASDHLWRRSKICFSNYFLGDKADHWVLDKREDQFVASILLGDFAEFSSKGGRRIDLILWMKKSYLSIVGASHAEVAVYVSQRNSNQRSRADKIWLNLLPITSLTSLIYFKLFHPLCIPNHPDHRNHGHHHRSQIEVLCLNLSIRDQPVRNVLRE